MQKRHPTGLQTTQAVQPAPWTRGRLRLASVAVLMLTQCVCQSNNRQTEPGPSAVVPAAAAANPVAPSDDTVVATSVDATAGASAKETTKVELPASVDPKDLDESERALLYEILDEQYDPCGKSRNFLESLRDPKTCAEAGKLAALAVDKIADGLSKRQVIQELLKEQSRWAKKVEFDLEGSPSFGDAATAKKVVVEFFDYQCPHCKHAAKPAKELAKKHGAAIYYKMLPLKHNLAAKDAALVALAAHRQGRFEVLHELLFENQDRLDAKVVRELAKEAGLDMKRLEADLAATGEGSVSALLERDMAESDRFKVGGTPTFYVDGIEVEFDQLGPALE